MEKDAHQAGNQQQNQAQEELTAQTGKVALGRPRIGCQAEGRDRRNQKRLAQYVAIAHGQVKRDERGQPQPFQESEEVEQEYIDSWFVDGKVERDQDNEASN